MPHSWRYWHVPPTERTDVTWKRDVLFPEPAPADAEVDSPLRAVLPDSLEREVLPEVLPEDVLPDVLLEEVLPEAVFAEEVLPEEVLRLLSAMFPTMRPRTSTRWPT